MFCPDRFYGGEIRAYDILTGEVDRPHDCFALYEVLEKHQLMHVNAMEASLKCDARQEAEKTSRKEEIYVSYSDDEGDYETVRPRTSSTDKPSFLSKVKVACLYVTSRITTFWEEMCALKNVTVCFEHVQRYLYLFYCDILTRNTNWLNMYCDVNRTWWLPRAILFSHWDIFITSGKLFTFLVYKLEILDCILNLVYPFTLS